MTKRVKSNPIKLSQQRQQTNAKRRIKKQIEADLSKLKELRGRELITEEVWTEKQKDILKEY